MRCCAREEGESRASAAPASPGWAVSKQADGRAPARRRAHDGHLPLFIGAILLRPTRTKVANIQTELYMYTW